MYRVNLISLHATATGFVAIGAVIYALVRIAGADIVIATIAGVR